MTLPFAPTHPAPPRGLRPLLALGALLLALSACDKPQTDGAAPQNSSGAGAVSALPAASTPTPAPPPAGQVKIAFVYVGSVGSGGWTYAHEIGRRAVDQAFGQRVSTTYIENVPEGQDAQRVIRDQIKQGASLVFVTAPGYAEVLSRSAGEAGNVRFELNHPPGRRNAGNVRSFDARSDESAYLAGVLAGSMSRSRVLGVVAPRPSAEVLRNINAFALGAQSSNPQIVTRVEWVREWYNPAREGSAAQNLFNGGADIVLQHTDSNAVLKKAEALGKMAIGWSSDMQPHAPKAHLASVVVNWAPYYVKTVGEALNGQWSGSGHSQWGLKEGMVDLVSLSDRVPPEVRARVDSARAALKDGSLQIWRGPLRSSTGKEVLKAGEIGSEAFLGRIDYYVQGIEGLPLVMN